MYVLVATDLTQGQRPDDYHHAWNDELVYLPFQECANPTCGCTRGFAGFQSHRATTTARVVDRADLTIERLCRLLAESLHEGGWLTAPDATNLSVVALADEMHQLARQYAEYGLGTVIEREGEDLRLRIPDAA